MKDVTIIQWLGREQTAPEDSDQNVKFSPLFVADVCVRERKVGLFSLKEQRPAPSYKQGLRITEYRLVSSEIPVCMQEAGDSRNITLEMKTRFSSANAWRLEKPLGSFDFKWGLFPREKSAAHLCKHMSRREEIARAGWLYQPAVKSEVEKSTLQVLGEWAVKALWPERGLGALECQVQWHPFPQ